MTALKDIAKIETTGLWRADADAQRIEVFVALGDGSLIMTDISNTALSHWALAAVERRNPGKTPALYAPGRDSPETLEIEDTTMIEAIERIRASIARRRPKPGRLRQSMLAAMVLLLLIGAVLWVPPTVRAHTQTVLPNAQRVAIGTAMLDRLTSLTGAACTGARGSAALTRLQARVLPEAPFRLVVVPNLPRPALLLPGGHLVLSTALLTPSMPPEALAGHLVAAQLEQELHPPLRAYLDTGGFRETFRLLTTGEPRTDTLRLYVDGLLTQPAPDLPAADVQAAFDARALPLAPYVKTLEAPSEALVTRAGDAPSAASPPLLGDTAWLTLTSICS